MPNTMAMPSTPTGLPPGVGPQGQPPSMPNMPSGGGMSSLPIMPMMPMEKMELKATGERTNLLGFACQRYELKQRGERMEIWATDQLFPYQAYLRNQPSRFGPRMLEEQWAGLLSAKHLFPLLASLRFDNGAERYRFEVKSVTSQKLNQAERGLLQVPHTTNTVNRGYWRLLARDGCRVF